MKWCEKIAAAEQHFQAWRENGREITQRFRGKRSLGYDNEIDYNIHHANGQLYISMVYPRTPMPVARRRKEAPESLILVDVLQKALRYTVDQYDVDEVIEPTMLDYYNAGLGQLIVNYVPYFQKVPTKKRLNELDGVFRDEDGNRHDEFEIDEEGAFVADTEERLMHEEIQFETIRWDHFCYDPDALTWEGVEWASIQYHFSEDEMERKFGKHKTGQVDWTAKRDESESYVEKRAKVYRVFDKVKREELWVCKGYPNEVISRQKDPWELEGFYPFPQPLMGTVTSNNFTPVPQYQIMEPLYQELDEVQSRIFNIMSAIKVRGAYNQAFQEELSNLVRADDNEYIPLDGWQQFQGEGGLEKQLNHWPIGDYVNALVTLSNQRNVIRQQIDEMTPFFDAARGGGRVEESASMTKAKTRYSDARLNREIKKVNKFIRNAYRIAGEMIAELFQAKTISAIVGMPFTEPMQELLRDDINRNILVDVEIDTDAYQQDQDKQQQLTEFLNALSGAMQVAMQAQQMGIDGSKIIERTIKAHPEFRDIESPAPLAPAPQSGGVPGGQNGSGSGQPQAN